MTKHRLERKHLALIALMLYYHVIMQEVWWYESTAVQDQKGLSRHRFEIALWQAFREGSTSFWPRQSKEHTTSWRGVGWFHKALRQATKEILLFGKNKVLFHPSGYISTVKEIAIWDRFRQVGNCFLCCTPLASWKAMQHCQHNCSMLWYRSANSNGFWKGAAIGDQALSTHL